MLNRITKITAPEGLSNIMDRDDGLVHDHSWTSSEAPHAGRRRAAMARQAAAARNQHHDHDDGLVHSHSWAVSSPER
ncbi:MAG TPA: hypothetical protein PLT25_07115 [Acidocella sp.]|nr:hypothetical protein [Acidocella sp.]HQU04471.1 hypothetical protein [Acidocella sp.]